MAAPKPRRGMITGINVTPLVDISLVLLVVFMVTAKLVANPGIPLDLPRAAQGEALQTVFSVQLPAEGPIQVNGRPIPALTALQTAARAAKAKDRELRAVIQADGAVPHRRVIAVMDQLKQAGLTRIAFGTQAPAPEPPQ